MALTSTKLIHLRSSVAGTVPTAAQLLDGQIAINTADKLVFIKDNTGAIIAIASALAITQAASAVQTVNGKIGPTVVLAPSDIGTNGVAPLDANGKVPLINLPESVLGSVSYQGTWDASSNTPTLANPPASSTKGNYYVVTAAGTQFGLNFGLGDWIISNGTAWQKVDALDAVQSVNGKTGAIVLTAADFNALDLTQGGTVTGNVTFSGSNTYSGSSQFTGAASFTGVTTVPNATADTQAVNLGQVNSLIANIPQPGGTVKSVDVSVPSILTSIGGPITTSGTIALGLATQAAAMVFAGPASGANATPTFRALAASDVPPLDEGTYA